MCLTLILLKNGGFQINSLFPNTDWYNEGNEVIDETREDGRVLAEKITALYPAYTLVRDSEGRIIDVVDDPVKREQLRQQEEQEAQESPPTLEERIQALEELELMRLFGGGDV